MEKLIELLEKLTAIAARYDDREVKEEQRKALKWEIKQAYKAWEDIDYKKNKELYRTNRYARTEEEIATDDKNKIKNKEIEKKYEKILDKAWNKFEKLSDKYSSIYYCYYDDDQN